MISQFLFPVVIFLTGFMFNLVEAICVFFPHLCEIAIQGKVQGKYKRLKKARVDVL